MDEAAIMRFLGGAEEGRIYRVGDTFRGFEFMVPWEQLEAGTEWAPGGEQGSYIVVAADGDGGDGGPDGGPDEDDDELGLYEGKGNGKDEGKGNAKGEGKGKGDGKGKPDDGNPFRMYRATARASPTTASSVGSPVTRVGSPGRS